MCTFSFVSCKHHAACTLPCRTVLHERKHSHEKAQSFFVVLLWPELSESMEKYTVIWRTLNPLSRYGGVFYQRKSFIFIDILLISLFSLSVVLYFIFIIFIIVFSSYYFLCKIFIWDSNALRTVFRTYNNRYIS